MFSLQGLVSRMSEPESESPRHALLTAAYSKHGEEKKKALLKAGFTLDFNETRRLLPRFVY